MNAPAAACADCGLPYASHGIDLTLPDDQWQRIAPENGLLCALCISRRVERLGGAVAIRAHVEFATKEEG